MHHRHWKGVYIGVLDLLVLDVFLTVHHELTIYINYQLLCTDYYLFIKY